jgi:stage II sporulation protein D
VPAPTVEASRPEPAEVAPPLVTTSEPLPAALELEAEVEEEVPVEIRVGLDSDLAEVELVAPEAGLEVEVAGAVRRIAQGERLAARAAVGSTLPGFFRVQVAALRDSRQAAGLAARQRQRTGWSADAIFDAATGFYRVRVGKFLLRSDAEAARRSLAAAGSPDAWIVTEMGVVAEPSIVLSAGQWTERIPGRELMVRSVDGPWAWNGNRYRGALVLFVNDRGSLNVINALDLESYLRGVVTREMGPGVYPWPEALRAQAIAARTYTLRHLEEFAHEGFDICATPRCQVYHGMADEHPLSAEAVAATDGVVLISGSEPGDTLYSASCGGHTEDVQHVFPTLRAEYLKGVPCIEGGTSTLTGAATDPIHRLAEELAPSLAPFGVETFAARLEALARRRGLLGPPLRLASLARTEVAAAVERRFGTALELASTSGVPPEPARGLLEGDGNLDEKDGGALIVELAEALDLTRPTRGGFHSVRDGRLRFRTEGEVQVAGFSKGYALARGAGLQDAVPKGAVEVAPGDPLEVWRVAGEVVAVIARPGETQGSRRVPLHRPWTRFKSRTELARRAALEYPGLELRGFEVLQRGTSSRVARLRLVGSNGHRELIEGLAIRWLLDIPDTRFDLEAAERQGSPGWLFSGRGWGHGVGMCQTGAALMARSGRSYEEILAHYYGGLDLGRVRRVERRSTWNGRSTETSGVVAPALSTRSLPLTPNP